MKIRLLSWGLPFGGLLLMVGLTLAEVKREDSRKEGKIRAGLPDAALVEPKSQRKLLVFSKTNGFHHQSIPVGLRAIELLGETTGAYQAVVSNDLANFEPEKIKEFDAICFLNTTMDVFRPRGFDKLDGAERGEAETRDQRLKESLMEFIKGGKGFVGIHAATDTFYEWEEYGQMLGGYFDGHPWTANTAVSIRVADGQETHPMVVHLGGENLEFKEEIYQFKDPYEVKELHMLLRLDTEKTNMDLKGIKRSDDDFGVAWIKNHGEGRVFYSSLGHNEAIYYEPRVLQHFLAGIQWALGDLEVECDPANAN